MNAPLKAALLCALVALLMTAPAVGASDDDQAPSSGSPPSGSPCETFRYTLDPPGYKLDLSCLVLGPVFDNSP